MLDNWSNVTIHEQTLPKSCFSSPYDISFSINRDTLEALKKDRN